MRKARKQVTHNVAALETMSLAELRTEWGRRYGAAPRHRAVDLLRRVLAWRIQADFHGGFDMPTRRMIEKEGAVKLAPLPGMRLAREWAGKRHEVVVIESGVVYEGQTFSSLTKVASHITGIHWNGPRFFGLRQANAQ